MKIYMKNCRYTSYYRKQGKYCFDFVWSYDLASDLTQEEADNILKNKNYYLSMYGTKEIGICE